LGARPSARISFTHTPFKELPEIIATAKGLNAKIKWTQSGLSAAGRNDPNCGWAAEDELRLARNLVQSEGLNDISEPLHRRCSSPDPGIAQILHWREMRGMPASTAPQANRSAKLGGPDQDRKVALAVNQLPRGA
jgi:hypothetical protein